MYRVCLYLGRLIATNVGFDRRGERVILMWGKWNFDRREKMVILVDVWKW